MNCESFGFAPLLRPEGYTEQTGDIVLFCSGGSLIEPGSALPTVTFQLVFNTQVTSRVYANGWSEVLLLIDEPNSGIQGTTNTQIACAAPDGNCPILSTGSPYGNYGSPGRPNVFMGKVSGNTVTFSNIPVAAIGSGFPWLSRVFRFTNIRVSAVGLPALSPVVASITVAGTTPLLLTDATPWVGFVGPGPSYNDSIDFNGATVDSCSTAQRLGVIRFGEKLQNALANRSGATFIDGDTSPAPAAQNVPGLIGGNESGFYNPALTAPTVDFSTVGLANWGTRLQAVLNNIPAGTRIWVSLRNAVVTGGTLIAASSGTVSRLISNPSGPFAAAPATTTLDGIPAAELTVTNGHATAVWEVLANKSYQLENMDFVVWAQAGTVPGTVSVNTSFAPNPADFPPDNADSSIPRFTPPTGPAAATFSSVACQVPTTTTLSVSASSVNANTPVTLTAIVSAASGIPAGTVTFRDGGTPLATVTVVNGSAGATTTFPAGNHTVTATFSPATGRFLSSTSAPVFLTVYPSPRTRAEITVTSSVNPSLIGQAVTFRAYITGASTPTGTVRFADGNTTLGIANVIAGQATFTSIFSTARNHDIFAYYSGDENLSEDSTRFGQTVNPFTPILTLTSNAVTATAADSLTLTAQLSAPPSGAPTATGRIQFFDGIVLLGSAPVSSGGASLTLTLPAGAHDLFALYSGDINWYSVRSKSLTVSIDRVVTTTLLTAVFNSAQTTLTAQVSATPNASLTGSVQFTDDTTGAILGASQISGGIGATTLSPAAALTLAGHSVTATYSGSGTHGGSRSNSVTLVALVSGTGSLSTAFAPDQSVSLYGADFAAGIEQASGSGLPQSLGGLALMITDSTGASRNAGISYVSSGQINFVMPAGLATGPFTLTLTRSGTLLYTLQGTIAPTAPGLFAITVSGDRLYLVLYGTGIRNRSSLANVTCVINGQQLPVTYAGQQSEFAGLDQVNVPLPVSLRGAGTVTINLIVDGQTSNPTTLILE